MTRFNLLLTGAAFAAASLLSGHALAQGAKQTVNLLGIDGLALATGYRTSKVVGSVVYNDANEQIGMIDDLIVTPKDRVPYAVISVGGFLGIGKHYVVVPASALEVVDKHMTLHGGTREILKSLPSYTYTY